MTYDDKNAFFRGLYDGYSRVDDAIPFPTLPSSLSLPEPNPNPRGSYALQDALATLRMLSQHYTGGELHTPRPLTPRDRIANLAGSVFWRAGNALTRLGELCDIAGDRVIDAGDDLAEWVAGR